MNGGNDQPAASDRATALPPVPPAAPPESLAGAATVQSRNQLGAAAGALAHPTRVGRYEIISVLGEGGMGVVYHARQTHPVSRDVALKLIKLGLDTREIVARFESERQTLAMMDHPNVARVFDAGADDLGRPYFVMEYVPGKPVTTSCEEQRLDIPARLDLFRQACAAVQHAHQKGVIHRDLKPSNILVTRVDAEPVVKVIDFGIAKAVAGDREAAFPVTERGQLIGTPEYMSPEQADNLDAQVDTRSDVYSLGIVLYELLTGSLPFDTRALRAAPLAEIPRLLRDSVPPRPSTMLLQRPAVPARAGAPVEDSRTRARMLRNDLDWVVMRAIEKDPQRRYASASELSADVERFLRREPVLAGPPSASYRMRKFVQRNRVGVIAGAAVLVALVVGGAGMTWQAIRATRAEREARVALAGEAAINDFLASTLESVNPEQALGKEVTVRQMLDAAAGRLGDDFGSQPKVEAKLRFTIGKTYNSLGRAEEAQEHLTRALDLAERQFGEDSDLALETIDLLGMIHTQRGEFATAEPLLRRGIELSRRRLGADHEQTLYQLNSLGVCLQSQDRFAEAEPVYREVLAGMSRKLGEDHEHVLSIRSNLAFLLGQLGRLRDAEAMLSQTLELQRKKLGPDHPSNLVMQNNLALLLMHLGEPARAEPIYKDALERTRRVTGADHPSTFGAAANLGNALRAKGSYAEAEAMLRSAIDGLSRTLGESVGAAMEARHNLALTYAAMARDEDAFRVIRETYEIAVRETANSSAAALMRARQRYAAALLRRQEYAEAERVAREAIALAGPLSPRAVVGELNATLAEALDATGRHEEANRVRASTRPTSLPAAP